MLVYKFWSLIYCSFNFFFWRIPYLSWLNDAIKIHRFSIQAIFCWNQASSYAWDNASSCLRSLFANKCFIQISIWLSCIHIYTCVWDLASTCAVSLKTWPNPCVKQGKIGWVPWIVHYPYPDCWKVERTQNTKKDVVRKMWTGLRLIERVSLQSPGVLVDNRFFQF